MSSYSEKAEKAFRDAELKKAELYIKIPLLKRMDDEISRLPLNILREAGLGSDGLQERLAKLKEEYDDLISARGELLRMSGYPENYTDIVYECDKCRDTGYDGINLCSCAKKQLTMENYKASGMYKLITTQSFDNFSLDVYKNPAHRSFMTTVYNNAKNMPRTSIPKPPLPCFL